jgi:D-hexose-6-phosphate mutarotase
MEIGLNVNDINFVETGKLTDQEVLDIMQEAKRETESIKAQQKQQTIQKKEQEKKIYKDEKLDKTIKIAEQTFIQIEVLLQKV